jgi:hypothetical protein
VLTLKMTDYSQMQSKYVLKRALQPTPDKQFFDDVEMQAKAAQLARAFNARTPPKPVRFLDAFVLEVVNPSAAPRALLMRQGRCAGAVCG